MDKTVVVDFHCHSSFSDGALSPERLAAKLAEAGVEYASLTDHDSLEGQALFAQVLSRRGIGCISGVEITADFSARDLHILGYGIDIDHAELREVLRELAARRNAVSPVPIPRPALPALEAISLIHRAGGIAVLAHPFALEPNSEKLAEIVRELREAGLDGIEALSNTVLVKESEGARALAERFGLLVTAGSDVHFSSNVPDRKPGVRMPLAQWKAFRDACLGRAMRNDSAAEARFAPPLPIETTGPGFRWRGFMSHIVLPSLLTLALFAGVLFLVFLPRFEKTLLDRKREMIRELTNAAWSVLNEAHREERMGLRTRVQAQEQAKLRVEAMRYGAEAKDYFWLQDLSPRMIMHPYRKDLNGADLSNYADPRGVRIFAAFVDVVKRGGEGYVDYVWQWKDDPRRLEPKESYLRLFEPWNWIIGTGIYMNDVKAEIDHLRDRMAGVSAGIAGLVALLLMVSVRASYRAETKRNTAEELLREAMERYRTLVEAAGEGALFVSGDRCRYANPVLLSWLGYSQRELELLDLEDVIPSGADNESATAILKQVNLGTPTGQAVRGKVRQKGGNMAECTLIFRRITEASPGGLMVLLRPIEIHDNAVATENRRHSVLERLLQLPAAMAQDLAGEISRAPAKDDIATICKGNPKLVKSLLDHGAYAPDIARLLAEVTDAATKRLLHLGMEALGEPPAPFVFLALGSQGRKEQTLSSDQDNAIVFDCADATSEAAAGSYFEALAKFVCAGLGESGYPECRGKALASNPRWCKPLGTWKAYFETWIQKAEPKELMEFSTFFDFRPVAGNAAMAAELRSHIARLLEISPAFFAQAAQNALVFKPPLRLFGHVLTTGAGAEHSTRLDLKAISMPLIAFARIYSMQQQISETNTLSRLEALTRKGVLLTSEYQDLSTTHESLLRLRIRHQSAAIERGEQPDNLLDPAWLSRIEQAVLKECFTEIDTIQSQLRRTFLGE